MVWGGRFAGTVEVGTAHWPVDIVHDAGSSGSGSCDSGKDGIAGAGRFADCMGMAPAVVREAGRSGNWRCVLMFHLGSQMCCYRTGTASLCFGLFRLGGSPLLRGSPGVPGLPPPDLLRRLQAAFSFLLFFLTFLWQRHDVS